MRYRRRSRGHSARMRAVIIAAVIVFVFVAALFVYDAIEDKRLLENQKEFEDRVRELNVEKSELRTEANLLNREVRDKLGSGACLPIVVYGTHTDLYDFIFPLFGGEEGSGILPSSGIVALSPEELPGLEGRMTRAQFDELIAGGWQAIVYWDGEGDLTEYLVYMNVLLGELDLPATDAVIFRNGAYKTEYDPTLIAEGIKYVFHSGEEYLDYVEDEPREDGALWHIGSVGWNTYGVSSTMLTTLLASGGVLAFTVDFAFGTSAYDGSNIACVASFERMFEKLDAARESEDLFITDLTMLEAIREDYIINANEILGENAVFLKELDQKIADIDKQIAEIYREYSN